MSSAGTTALVTGIHDQLIDSAVEVIAALKHLVMGPDRWIGARLYPAAVRWTVVVPVAVGMVVALWRVAGPVRLAGTPRRICELAVVAGAAAAAFLVVSVPATTLAR